ncbi:hypothetical protein LJR168_000266 [Pseudoxanthomonas sp. LjRoot168]|uniref:hypothetical protein n=1 Tax=unclassified Pseudoxanthomonas TaxID=2645906 RepID=UPI003ED1307D
MPSWAFIATSEDDKLIILNEGVPAAQLTNKAFVRNGERGLRTVEVPIYEARLWRAGIAVSDYYGYIEDLGKYGETDDPPLDGAALSDISAYVIRCQLRKLRGEYANSTTSRRIEGADQLPVSVERSLKFLESFPEGGGDEQNRQQISALLANEADLAAMRIRYTYQPAELLPTEFLRRLADRVVGRLPGEVGQMLGLGSRRTGLRSDLSALLPLVEVIHDMSPGGDDLGASYAWRMLQAGMVSSAIAVAFQGIAISLRAQGEFFIPGMEVPSVEVDLGGPEFTPSTAAAPPAAEVGRGLSSIVRGVYLRSVVAAQSEDPRICVETDTIGRLSELITVLERADQCEEEGDWPFLDIGLGTVELLTMDLLERAIELVSTLDSQLQFANIRVVSPTYGYDAQGKRFRDHRDQEWEIQTWMIGQYPPDRKIEEIVSGGKVLKAWTETVDLRSRRLVSISVAGRALAKLSQPQDAGQATSSSPSTEIKQVRESRYSVDEVHEDLNRDSIDDGASDGRGIHHEAPKSDDDPGVRRSVREGQRDNWQQRKDLKNPAHVRVAILQSEQELSYFHPMMEVHARSWPLNEGAAEAITEACKRELPKWNELDLASSARGLEHKWNREGELFPSWHEHRRQRMLKRAIEACEALGVDILMLPEYSVRQKTVEWIQDELKGKNLSVLAGTYKNFEHFPQEKALQAILTLLWPVVDIPSSASTHKDTSRSDVSGQVLVLSRPKKYRSVGLSEHIRPSNDALSPLFKPGQLVSRIAEHGNVLTVEQVNALLTDKPLPLKHFAELVCSEIFALTSPLNFRHIQDDYGAFCKKFGFAASETAVRDDVFNLGELLAAGARGASSDRRSVLMVPAATTRTADYWLAGQASLLAGGTTTVFCNGTGAHLLKGGSCFIGRASWSREHSEAGYIPTCTPYHGWSKGIFYNNSSDALSEKDQAVVVADIDPYNMIEGKPRPQMLPVPLQLVAYLPIVEVVDSHDIKTPVCSSLGVATTKVKGGVNLESRRVHESKKFWSLVMDVSKGSRYKDFAKCFSDPAAVTARIEAFKSDADQLPHAGTLASGLWASPALYDWLDVDLTLRHDEQLPEISVPSWIR